MATPTPEAKKRGAVGGSSPAAPCLLIARSTSERIHPPERPVAARRRLWLVALRLQHRVTLEWECRGASPGAVRWIESPVKHRAGQRRVDRRTQRDVLEGLGVRPDEERVFVVADGRAVRYPIAWVRVRLDERTQPTLVVCGDSGTEPLLGAFTLEGFGLGVDPVNRRLIPVPGLLKAVA